MLAVSRWFGAARTCSKRRCVMVLTGCERNLEGGFGVGSWEPVALRWEAD